MKRVPLNANVYAFEIYKLNWSDFASGGIRVVEHPTTNSEVMGLNLGAA